MAKKDKKKSKKKESKSFNYKSTPEYKSLTNDEKKLIDLNYAVQTGTSKYTSTQLKAALKKAKKDSSGYFKQIIRETETSISAQVAAETGDYQSHLDTINENIKEINEDLATNKANLSLEEQQVLASQARSYEQTRGNLIQQISGQGTTFSSVGEQQKSAAEAENKGIVESTTSKYNKQIADLETQAARGNIQAQQQLADLKRTHQENIQSLGLKAETYLGTKGLKGLNLGAYQPLGKIAGTITEDKAKDVSQRQMSYLDTAKQTSLQF